MTMRKPRCIVLSAAAMTALALAANVAAEGMKIGGTITCKNVKQEAMPFNAQEFSLLLLEEFHCTNRSHGTTEYMDGADVVNQDVAALFRGSGPNHGYITFRKGEDSSVTKWTGQVTTVMSADGQPQTSLHGTWEKLIGTGKYQGIQGRGGYRGQFTSPTEYVLTFSGEITVPVASK